jgi:hypothetical protein
MQRVVEKVICVYMKDRYEISYHRVSVGAMIRVRG